MITATGVLGLSVSPSRSMVTELSLGPVGPVGAVGAARGRRGRSSRSGAAATGDAPGPAARRDGGRGARPRPRAEQVDREDGVHGAPRSRRLRGSADEAGAVSGERRSAAASGGRLAAARACRQVRRESTRAASAVGRRAPERARLRRPAAVRPRAGRAARLVGTWPPRPATPARATRRSVRARRGRARSSRLTCVVGGAEHQHAAADGDHGDRRAAAQSGWRCSDLHQGARRGRGTACAPNRASSSISPTTTASEMTSRTVSSSTVSSPSRCRRRSR